jgi:hypothetical protein
MATKNSKATQPGTSNAPTNNRKKILNNQQVLTSSQKN